MPVVRIGDSSVTLREEIRTVGGELAAEAEAVIVARDRRAWAVARADQAERDAFERVLVPNEQRR